MRPASNTPSDTANGLALGDIVTLPDGRALTLRSLVKLGSPVAELSGFLLLGELEALLTLPARPAQPLGVFMPVNRFPVDPNLARSVAEGAARYWAPHLPALGKAMGEITYRVVTVQGSVTPIIIVYVGPDAVVFMQTGVVWGAQLDLTLMDRDPSNENVDVRRHSGDVNVVPSYVPATDAEIYSTITRR